MKTKRCSGCKETKPVSEFHNNRSTKDGLSYECKMCVYESNRRYRKANKEKVAEYKRRYQKANKEKVAKWGRRYREVNKERVAENKRRYYGANQRQVSRRTSKHLRKTNERSLECAHRQGLPWEDWEDDFILADNGLTCYQKSVKLERTYCAIRARLARLRKKAKTS